MRSSGFQKRTTIGVSHARSGGGEGPARDAKSWVSASESTTSTRFRAEGVKNACVAAWFTGAKLVTHLVVREPPGSCAGHRRVGKGRRRALDAVRLPEDDREVAAIRRREEVRKQPVRQRADAHRHLRDGIAEVLGERERTLEATLTVHRPRCQHRPGVVDRDHDLGVGPHALLVLTLNRRLSRGKPEESEEPEQAERPSEQRPAGRIGKVELAAQRPAGAQLVRARS